MKAETIATVEMPGLQRIACLHADVVGYCRLIAHDVTSTVRTLTAHRAMMIEAITRQGGTVIDTAGDSLLATFSGAGDAVACAVEIQQELARRNARLLPERRITFRIGIELGDALVEDGRVYGHCVNVAARVQQAAQPGSIYVAGRAHDDIEGALPWRLEYVGRSSVKSIDEPQRLYRVN